jgi:hypothetical protein
MFYLVFIKNKTAPTKTKIWISHASFTIALRDNTPESNYTDTA